MALSIATGLIKAIMVMVGTPIAAGFLGLQDAALGDGVRRPGRHGERRVGGLAATDRKLVPYGALVATFHTGLGCLMGPSILFFAVKALVG
jgi:malonate transporter MadM subunit